MIDPSANHPPHLNLGHACTRLPCDLGLGGKVAMQWYSHDLQRRDYTFSDLERESNRFARVLVEAGLKPGDVLFTYLPKCPEQFFSVLGALKTRAITGTLFSNFGEDALLDRLGDAQAKAIVTTRRGLKKLQRIRAKLPALRLIYLVDGEEDPGQGVLSYAKATAAAPPEFTAAATDPATPSTLHYTSGSTGKPKGVLHKHGMLPQLLRTAREVLDLQEEDHFWCTADQGWITGMSYGIFAPWSLGITQIHFGGTYNVEHWMHLLEAGDVSIWYTAPTALRMLMREDPAAFSAARTEAIRHIFSVGEPLNPEVISWARQMFQRDVYDTWFQTETGAISISNRPGLEIRPGSMGIPVTGVTPVILDDEGHEAATRAHGHLCLKDDCPSLLVTYLNNESVYRSKFKAGFYYTGDTAFRDEDGYIWFQGRSDDVINTSGHLVSPFEVESALIEIPEITESGVVGVPDPLLFEKIIAYISLREGCTWTQELEVKARVHVSNRVSTIACPQEFIPVPSVPKNKSGKIMRRVLRSQYLGADCGDLSTMEGD